MNIRISLLEAFHEGTRSKDVVRRTDDGVATVSGVRGWAVGEAEESGDSPVIAGGANLVSCGAASFGSYFSGETRGSVSSLLYRMHCRVGD